MARLSVFMLAASALALSACGPKAEVAPAVPAAPAAPVFSDTWHSISAIPSGPGPASLNVHTTAQGPQGHIWRDAKLYPVRNLALSDTAMSFMTPALGISWSATKDASGKWSGSWTSGDATLPAVLDTTTAPDLGGARFVTLVDGRQMYLDCRGEGAPVVVFDAGAGGWSKDWAPVHDEVAKTTMACAYDRAGHGLSDPRPLPLDTAAIADDLDAMLT
ncbi:MAG TPA: alpha/beta hydrolase, partial [Hyphomonadaceae bacterium]|nr:alpha/beta hydrolase [Hyphomonadaceae bacterium]